MEGANCSESCVFGGLYKLEKGLNINVLQNFLTSYLQFIKLIEALYSFVQLTRNTR
jgi:hypothetical protein